MRLIIAEKPSMGRAIAAALGIRGGGDGCIEGQQAVVTWCIGHLVELAPPEAYDPALKRWSLTTLPVLPDAFQLVPIPRSAGQFRVIRRLLSRRDVTEVVNACDSGREGELIFDLVMRLARCSKPVLRLWTASLTEEAIREAYRQMRPASAFSGLRDAARSRAEADWLVGLNATRAQTLVAQRAGHAGVWSLGRVQTPTLALVVARDLAIRDFVAEDYWTVLARLEAAGGAFSATWFRQDGERATERVSSEEEARAISRRAAAGPATVVDVQEKRVTLPPERLYDLTTLQRECNRRFGFTAKRTLAIAQALYEEHRVITYPRTNSRHMTRDVARTLPALLQSLARHAPHAAHAQAALARGPVVLGRRFVDDTEVEDHHAIIPTGKLPGSLSEDESRVHDLVARRLIAAHHPDRVELRTVAILTLATERFRARGVVVVEPGWTAVEPPAPPRRKDEGEGTDDEGAPLPPLNRGAQPRIAGVEPRKGRTKPPPAYTDGTLLGAMEGAGKELTDDEARLAMKDCGLGTPATRAAILEALVAREYLVRRGRKLEAMPKAVALIEGLAVPALASAELTGHWEAKLARMARSQYERPIFMGEIKRFTADTVATLRVSTLPSLPAGSAPAGAQQERPRRRGNARGTGAAATIQCPGCGRPARVVYSKVKKRQFGRCDPCDRWI